LQSNINLLTQENENLIKKAHVDSEKFKKEIEDLNNEKKKKQHQKNILDREIN